MRLRSLVGLTPRNGSTSALGKLIPASSGGQPASGFMSDACVSGPGVKTDPWAGPAVSAAAETASATPETTRYENAIEHSFLPPGPHPERRTYLRGDRSTAFRSTIVDRSCHADG